VAVAAAVDPTLRVSLGALERSVWFDRLARQLSRREQSTLARIARELVAAAARCQLRQAPTPPTPDNTRRR
jgi:hypothetical protein